MSLYRDACCPMCPHPGVSPVLLAAIPAMPRPVGSGMRGCPPLCFRRSLRAVLMRAQLQPPCQTGSSRPCMHWMICSFSPALRSPRVWATYVMKAMSMFTASPCINDGKTL